jgi:hypothetical protein
LISQYSMENLEIDSIPLNLVGTIAYMRTMRRIAQVLVFLALGIQFASGAHLLDQHQEWDRKCESRSYHFCNDVWTHDAGSCAICLVCASGLTFDVSEIPEFTRIDAPFVPISVSTPIFTRECDCSCPRGPPAPIA